ncbi:uncharacterized protein STEHIDRAFT_164177 [Stereum hirsutum FP-91666 SS1]|uniref:Uncharacterized protein n=1 Tax=Stereum hirsutum (strain FP-91666) TaxID=721885 RepID=R7RX19_STEHR|nr:uncharacterized protein STEHIDRAFT_164177 [Stereum hirsutum FP-91666 SS1]EIM78942.1 hypothetical protein STEHIDRAFT_164177 [Stereum hirsutum FP-91666 SS1]
MPAASRFPVELVQLSMKTLDVTDLARAATAFRLSASDDFAEADDVDKASVLGFDTSTELGTRRRSSYCTDLSMGANSLRLQAPRCCIQKLSQAAPI